MSIKKFLLQAILSVGLLAAGQVAEAQQLPGVPSVESGKWLVRLVRFERSGSDFSEYAFTFNALNRESGAQAVLQLRNQTTDIDNIEITGGKLVVLGSVGSSADIVSVFDLESGGKLGEFLCWSPRMSATGRYVVAVGFFPRFTDPDVENRSVALYDLHGSGKVRPAGEEGSARLRPIFPEEGSQPGKGNEKEAGRHSVNVEAGFLWSQKDDRLAFVDRHLEDSWLVAIDLMEGRAKAVRRYPLDVASILTLPKSDPSYTETLRRERTGIPIRGMYWDGEDVVVVQIDRNRAGQGQLYRTDWLRVNVAAAAQ